MIDKKEYQKQYRIKNRDRLIAYKKAWVLENAEKVKIDAKNRYQEKKEEIKKYVAGYKKLNPAKANANKAKRKAAKKLRTPAWLTEIDYERIQNQYKLASILTKLHKEPWHIDHIIPLQGKLVSGLHVPSNLQVLRGSENCSKQNQYDI